VRNGFGDVIRRTSPDTGATDYVYNALGKPTQITDARSVVTNLTYDNAGHLTILASGRELRYDFRSRSLGRPL